jgi:hypothetical protein
MGQIHPEQIAEQIQRNLNPNAEIERRMRRYTEALDWSAPNHAAGGQLV